MNADRYFAMGRLHPICQDYALVDNRPGQVAAFLSDGCSTSPGTDFGSRFMCMAAAGRRGGSLDLDPLSIALRAYAMADSVGLPVRCLDATLLIAQVQRDRIRVFVFGDGVVASRSRDGTVGHTVIECPSGAPDYISYLLDPVRRAVYREQVQGLKTVTCYKGDEILNQYEIEPFIPVCLDYFTEENDLVALMSDGAGSFQRMANGRTVDVPTHLVVEQVMAVKNTSKEFMVRRVRNGFLGRHCVREGWQHYDDLGVAAIAIPEWEDPDDMLAGLLDD